MIASRIRPTTDQAGSGSDDLVRGAVDAIVARVRGAEAPVVFFANAHGDHLLCRPTLAALQGELSGRLGFVGVPGMADLFFGDLGLRCSHTVSFGHQYAFSAHDFLLFRDDFDAVIDLNWWDSRDMRDLRRILHGVPIVSLCGSYGMFPPFKSSDHMADYAFQVTQRFGTVQPIEAYVHLPTADWRSGPLWDLFKQRLAPGARVLAVHTVTLPNKQWQSAGFRAVIDAFLERHNDFVVLVVDPFDAGVGSGKRSDRIFRLEDAGLSTTTAFVAHCDLFLGIDSYFLHAADFARVPSVGLFGSTLPTQWGCRFAPYRHVVADRMEAIEVSAVLAALEALVDVKAPLIRAAP